MGLYYHAGRLAVRTVFGVAGWRVEGAENVPASGGLIVASNHISFSDPPIVGAALPRESYFLAKEELFANPAFGWLIGSFNAIPIRRGMSDLKGLARAFAALREGKVLILFPEGGRMKDGELHPARPGLGMIAVQADVPILPCYVWGTNRPRRWLGRRVRPHVTLGHARAWREWAGEAAGQEPGRGLYQAIGDGVMQEIGRLKAHQEEQRTSRGTARMRRA
jgi:1-acyl-sn-glycerol-3-phosphate acyltransferase